MRSRWQPGGEREGAVPRQRLLPVTPQQHALPLGQAGGERAGQWGAAGFAVVLTAAAQTVAHAQSGVVRRVPGGELAAGCRVQLPQHKAAATSFPCSGLCCVFFFPLKTAASARAGQRRPPCLALTGWAWPPGKCRPLR